nr:MAG TPA: hypothetical protein [Caudoviricetes sp.]
MACERISRQHGKGCSLSHRQTLVKTKNHKA